MAIKITLPSLSSTMSHGTLVKWLVAEGEPVHAGQIIAEIETDKSILELESPADGIIVKQFFSEGTEEIAVGADIALIDDNGQVHDKEVGGSETYATAKTGSNSSASNKAQATTTPSKPATSDGGRLRASPLAKKLGTAAGIDLKMLQGSGPGGRIIKRDILAAQQTTPVAAAAPANASAENTDNYTETPLSGMRKVIAQKLQFSKQTIPHFYLRVDIELDKLITLRKELNQSIVPERASINDFIIRACAMSLRKFPGVNVQLVDHVIREYHQVDIAVAVALKNGLITPVIRNADRLSVTNIANETSRLARKAREGKMPPEDYQGGTFTLSNLGMHGVKSFDAIINPPQASVLAVGAAEERAVVKNSTVTPATVLSATLSCDHRVIDGTLGAAFLANIKTLLENPLSLLT